MSFVSCLLWLCPPASCSSSSNQKEIGSIMSKSISIVDYENLTDYTSLTDANMSIRTSVRSRWERKKSHQLASLDGERPPLTSRSNGDRFIPNRAGMNMDLSRHLVRGTSFEEASFDDGACDDHHKSVTDAKRTRYNSSLSSALFGVEDLQGNRVISYQDKAPAPKADPINNLNILYSASDSLAKKKDMPRLVTRQIPSAPTRILDAPDLMDDYYLNLISWSDTNILAVALAQTVYLWNAESGDIQELCTYDPSPNAYISSVSWVQEGGAHIAVGTSTGKTQLWDVNECKQLRSMDGHSDRVNALGWNRHVLSSGSRDSVVVNHDVRAARHNVATLSHHTQEVCSLAWSLDGTILASGGNDNLVCLWDASSSSSSTPQFCFSDHQAAVKALAWSPHEKNLLASGGGTADRSIKFWNSKSGALLNSIDAGSQVCSLQWSPFEKEILSSHGFSRNQLSLWKYPTMAKIKDLEGHQARVLHMAMSPDGSTVVSAAADETLRFWNVFAPPVKRKADMVFQSGSPKSSWTAQIR
jgi:cell division cycle 20, cofactor of APC complex